MLGSAWSALLRKGGAGRPTVSRSVLYRPDSAYRKFQIVAITTNEATTGRKYAVRKNPSARTRSLTSRARARPRITWAATLMTVYSPDTSNDFSTPGSDRRRT